MYRNLVGRRFGMLTVIEPSFTDASSGRLRRKTKCRCNCGTVVVVHQDNLIKKNTKSCGCLSREHPNARTHGMRNAPEYSVWKAMRQRCLNPNSPFYSYYGGRGITICKAWDDFMAFYRDMGARPSPQHTIDRIDNDKGYSPNNCRWATKSQQANNRSYCILLKHDGRTKNIRWWSRELGIHHKTITDRLERGWSVERTLTAPVQAEKRNMRAKGRSNGAASAGF